ncbi:3'-5' exonuclease [Psychrosphaera aquimarina]|uniref:3'-5' exonuclease n=1 Tax=Psychrosphaera aquimarina TaxID=2044854 RepID=A0ABU3QXJ4_9GAMM|nr:3'-5' exonuclease [Psychrosphaera aquimarina]MDU0111773.1 3'-5' exonuclease [Psychrosphaera aquimarina]
MYVLGLDLETTGLSFEQDEIIEIGAVVWDTHSNKPVAMLNHLVQQPTKLPLADIIVQITGITDKDLTEFGIQEKQAISEFAALANKCEFIVAHNGNQFDKKFICKALNKYSFQLNIPWIDSMVDVPFNSSTKQLVHLAAEHKFLNPFSHRALFDVLTMLKVCSEYDWNEVAKRSQSPEVTVIAKVSKDDRQLAKDKGFRWDPNSYKWFKTYKECDLKGQTFDFEIEVVDL